MNKQLILEKYIKVAVRKALKEQEEQQKRAEKALYLVYRFPGLKKLMEDLMSPVFGRFISHIEIVAPKPTTFDIKLINGQDFNIIYVGKGNFIVKVSGKKYNPLNLGELERASQSIADLLQLNYAPEEGKEQTSPEAGIKSDLEKGAKETPPAEEKPAEEETPEPVAEGVKKKAKTLDKILLELSNQFPLIKEIIEENELEEAMLSLNSVQKRPHQFSTIFYNKEPFQVGKTGEDKFIADYIVIGDETFDAKNESEKSNLEGALKNVQNARNVKIVGQLNGQQTTLNISSIYKSANLGGQGDGGAGVSNEKELVDAINNAIAQNEGNSIDVKFIDNNKKEISIPDVTQAKGMGTTGSKKGLKGDVTLVTKNGDQNLSVKKDGNYWWSSERKNFSELLDKFIGQGIAGKIPNLILKQNPDQPKILDMIDPKDGRKYGRVFILNYPGIDDNLEKITFGPDGAKIVQRSFSPSDYSLENGVLTIKTTRNMNDVSDLTAEDKPVISLARHENQGHGIDFRTIPYKQAKLEPTRGGKTLVLDYTKTPSLQ